MRLIIHLKKNVDYMDFAAVSLPKTPAVSNIGFPQLEQEGALTMGFGHNVYGREG